MVDKITFCEIIEEISNEHFLEKDLTKIFKEHGRVDFVLNGIYCNDKIVNYLIDLLEENLNEKEKTIRWWLEEFLFWGEGPSLLIDGEMKTLTSAADLYDFIIDKN